MIVKFEIEITEEQKEDLRKRIFISNMTTSQYLGMIMESFDNHSQFSSTELNTLEKMKIEIKTQHSIISEQREIIDELKNHLHQTKSNLQKLMK